MTEGAGDPEAPGQAWDRGLLEAAPPGGRPSLLQSWAWGEVQAREGWRVERLALGGLRATVLLRGPGPAALAYVPRGPVPAGPAEIDRLIAWARRRRMASLRVEADAPPGLAEGLRDRGFVRAAPVQPERTAIVRLGPEAEMLAAFKPKHRYNIRLALRRGVEVEESRDPDELRRQSAATAARQGISLLRAGQYRLRLERLDWCRTYVARVDGEALAAIMVARFAGRAYYLYGGSSGRRTDLQPSYAAQWAAMRAAAAAGCDEYDLWGIPPDADPGHPWAGLRQFKDGFRGAAVEYCGAWELRLGGPLRAGVGEGLSRAARLGRRIFTS